MSEVGQWVQWDRVVEWGVSEVGGCCDGIGWLIRRLQWLWLAQNLEHMAMMERVFGEIPKEMVRKADKHSIKYFDSTSVGPAALSKAVGLCLCCAWYILKGGEYPPFWPDVLRFTSDETISANRHRSYAPIGPQTARFSEIEASVGHAVIRCIANSHWLLSSYEVWFVVDFESPQIIVVPTGFYNHKTADGKNPSFRSSFLTVDSQLHTIAETF